MRIPTPTVADIQSTPDAETTVSAPTPIEQVLAAARSRSADRKARWEKPVATTAPAVKSAPAPAAPLRGRVLKCRVCGKAEPRTAVDLKRLARGAWPMCCDQVMFPLIEPPSESPTADDELPWADRRQNDRRPGRPGSRVEVRRGLLGMSPDVALKLVDVSEGGAQVRLKCGLRPGEQVEVALWPPADVQSVRGPAVVCWCLPTPTGEFRAGLRLRRKLIKEVVDLLAE